MYTSHATIALAELDSVQNDVWCVCEGSQSFGIGLPNVFCWNNITDVNYLDDHDVFFFNGHKNQFIKLKVCIYLPLRRTFHVLKLCPRVDLYTTNGVISVPKLCRICKLQKSLKVNPCLTSVVICTA